MTIIHSPVELKRFVIQNSEGRKFCLNEKGGKYLGDVLIYPFLRDGRRKNLSQSVILLVGPEGGWTDVEEQFILNNDFEVVSLGPLVMRSETAAIGSVALISHLWNK